MKDGSVRRLPTGKDGMPYFRDSYPLVRHIYRVFLVQPGVTKAGLSAKSGEVLAATHDYLTKSGVRDVFVIGSR
jgi:hypothetical protein